MTGAGAQYFRMSDNLHSRAGVQYNDWTGRLPHDVDFTELTTLLGVDREQWWLLVVDATVYGGSQQVIGWAVPDSTTFNDLTATLRPGEAIK